MPSKSAIGACSLHSPDISAKTPQYLSRAANCTTIQWQQCVDTVAAVCSHQTLEEPCQRNRNLRRFGAGRPPHTGNGARRRRPRAEQRVPLPVACAVIPRRGSPNKARGRTAAEEPSRIRILKRRLSPGNSRTAKALLRSCRGYTGARAASRGGRSEENSKGSRSQLPRPRGLAAAAARAAASCDQFSRTFASETRSLSHRSEPRWRRRA